MKHATEAAAKLRQAIEAERQSLIHTAEFTNLVEKMASFYEGRGSAPEVDDFLAWRNSIDQKKRDRVSNLGGPA